jgi:transposase
MEERLDQVVSPPTPAGAAEERMLRADLVREMVARAQRGEGVKRIARELGVDRKTVKRWLRLGTWQPRRHQPRPRPIDGFVEFMERRGPEVGWNGVVLYRELAGLGFTGSYQQVQRFLKPYRAKRKWSELATVRFETAPGEQAQVDFGHFRYRTPEGGTRAVWAFVLVLSWSRAIYVEYVRRVDLPTFLGATRAPSSSWAASR